MTLCTLNGPIDVGTLDVENMGIIILLIDSASKQGLPILIINHLSQHVMHMLALRRQFSKQTLFLNILRDLSFMQINQRISRPMPKDLLHEDQFLNLSHPTQQHH